MLVFFYDFWLHVMETHTLPAMTSNSPPSIHLSSWYPKVPPNRPSNPGRRDQSQDCRATTTTDGSLSHFNGVGWEVGFPRFSWNPHVDGSENRGVPPKSSHFKRVFHYKIINHPFLGTPYFWKHPHGVMENDQIWKALLAGP